MINFYNSASRDFQYLSWLINIVLNSVKHNVDDLYELPSAKANPRLAELFALTLGFKVKRNYNREQLIALASSIPSLLKYKGSIKAVAMAGEALVAASGTTSSFDPDTFLKIENNTLIVTFPKNLVDIILFTDLLPYILPAGMSCHIIRKDIVKRAYTTKITNSSTLQAKLVIDLDWDEDTQKTTGLTELFNPGSSLNSLENLTEHKDLVSGLLDSSVIPALEGQLFNGGEQQSKTINTDLDKHKEGLL